MLPFSTVTFLQCEIIGSYLIKSLHLYFLVYGFQNNLAPTSASVLTTSGANVNANLGGKKTFFLSSFFPLISKLCLSYIFIYAFVFTGYGVQKNVTNGGSGISTGVSTGKSATV